MQDDVVILHADMGKRVRAAIPALVLIVFCAAIALWLSIPFGPFGMFAMFLFIAAGVVLFLMRTTSVSLSVGNDAVVVRNTLRTTRIPIDEVDGMALMPDGDLQVLSKKHSVGVEAAEGMHEEDVAVAAERVMDEIDGRVSNVASYVSPYATSTGTEAGDAEITDA